MRRSGFTFIELLVALSLFAVGMLSVLEIFPVTRSFLTQSASATQATFLAQQELETIRSLPYADLTPGIYEPLHAVTADTSNQLSQFQRQTVVTLVDPESSPVPYATSAADVGMKKVEVTVSWLEKTRTRQLALATYVFQK